MKKKKKKRKMKTMEGKQDSMGETKDSHRGGRVDAIWK